MRRRSGRQGESGRDRPTGRFPDRRGFIARTAALGLGAVAYLVPVVGGLAAFLNPLREKGSGGGFLRLASLDALPRDGTPRRFPVVAQRVDAWTRSVEPVGAVFLRRAAEGGVEAWQVLCPHAGCSVQLGKVVDEKTGNRVDGFHCPCHKASFGLDGRRLQERSQSPRDLDGLDAEIRNGTEVWVRFQRFQFGTESKVPVG